MSDTVSLHAATNFWTKPELTGKGVQNAIVRAWKLRERQVLSKIILGANGRLGGILRRQSDRAGSKWHTQARDGSGDIHWSGDFNAPEAADVLKPGATLINMIGATGEDDDVLTLCNVRFVETLLQRAADAGVAHVVLASSAAVYGIGQDTPLTEDTPLKPLSPYGVSKVKMEAIAQTAQTGSRYPAITILRIANVAGADALLAAAESRAALGQPMALHRFTNGEAPLRSYIGPQDLFSAIDALSSPHNEGVRIVNVTAPQPVRLDDALTAYKSRILPNLNWHDEPVPDGVPEKVVLSSARLEQFISFDRTKNYADTMAQQVVEDRTS